MKDLELHRFFFFTMRSPLRGSQEGAADSSERKRDAPKGFPVPSEYKQTLENALKRGEYEKLNNLVTEVAEQTVFPTHFPKRLFSGEVLPAANWKEISKTPTQEAAESSSQQHPPNANTSNGNPDQEAPAENLHQKAADSNQNTPQTAKDSNQNTPQTAKVLVDAIATTDALYVLFSVAYHNGQYDPNNPEKLKKDIAELLEISKDIQSEGDQFLGEARCWCIQADGKPTRSDVLKLWSVLHSQSSDQSDSSQTPSENKPCQILQSTDGVVLAFDPEPETYLIVYSSQNHNQLNEIQHHALPLIALQRLKIRDISENYPRVYEKATAIEQDLEAKMEAARTPQRLEDIERLSLEVSTLQQEFIEQVSILENYKKTLEISVRNIRMACDKFGLTPESTSESEGSKFGLTPENTSESEGCNPDEVWETLTRQSEVSFDIDQIETHLYYLSSTRGQAELALESLNTAATVRNAQWLRAITYIGAPFAAASIIEAFQSDIEALGKSLASSPSPLVMFVLKLVILAALVAGFYYSVKRLTRPARTQKVGTSSKEK